LEPSTPVKGYRSVSFFSRSKKRYEPQSPSFSFFSFLRVPPSFLVLPDIRPAPNSFVFLLLSPSPFKLFYRPLTVSLFPFSQNRDEAILPFSPRVLIGHAFHCLIPTELLLQVPFDFISPFPVGAVPFPRLWYPLYNITRCPSFLLRF